MTGEEKYVYLVRELCLNEDMMIIATITLNRQRQTSRDNSKFHSNETI